MKSIAYTKYDDKNDCYDLEVENGDFKIINDSDNMKSLSNDVLTSILTRKNELSHLVGYENFGCEIHNIPKQMNTQMIQFLSQEYIRESLNLISRIKHIKKIIIHHQDEDELKINILIECDDDEQYNLQI